MTAVTTRPVLDTADSTYRRQSKHGFFAITTATALIAVWALVVLVAFSVPLGLLGLALAAVVGFVDAAFNTPTAIEVTPVSVTLHYWRRTRRFAPRDVVLTHDVPRDRFTLHRRGKKRSLMHWRERNSTTTTRTFVAAGVEIVSQ